MHLQYLHLFGCQADFDVDNVARRQLVNVYAVCCCIRVIIIIIIICTPYILEYCNERGIIPSSHYESMNQNS